jgi:hypothetical protein
VPVFDTDVGRIAVLICWDMDFPELWHAAASQGAEMILWPSAGKGGTPISGYAQIHNMNLAANGAGQFYDRIGRVTPPDAAWNYTLPPLPHGRARLHGEDVLVTMKEIDLDETVVFYGGPKAKQEKYASFLAEATGSGAVTEVYRDNISHWSMLRRGGGEGARENAAAAEQGQEQQGQEQQGQQELRGSGVGAGGAGSGGGGSVREALRAAGIETRREESMRNRLRNNQLRLKDPSLH